MLVPKSYVYQDNSAIRVNRQFSDLAYWGKKDVLTPEQLAYCTKTIQELTPQKVREYVNEEGQTLSEITSNSSLLLYMLQERAIPVDQYIPIFERLSAQKIGVEVRDRVIKLLFERIPPAEIKHYKKAESVKRISSDSMPSFGYTLAGKRSISGYY